MRIGYLVLLALTFGNSIGESRQFHKNAFENNIKIKVVAETGFEPAPKRLIIQGCYNIILGDSIRWAVY